MIQLKYNGEFIDLASGQSFEFQRENPLFLIEDLFKEFSTPITIPYSENNAKSLGDKFFFQPIKHQVKLDVELWQEGGFYMLAVLVINKSIASTNSKASSLSGFLLSGLSIVLNKLKDRKVCTMEIGGTITMPFTTINIADGSNGYLQQFYRTRNNNDNYIVAPVRNDGWTEEESKFPYRHFGTLKDVLYYNGIVNNFFSPDAPSDPGQHLRSIFFFASLFPRLKYVLVEIFRESGFILDTTDLDGSGWENIFLYSGKIVELGTIIWDVYIGFQYVPSIKFRLAQFISPEVTCKQMILEHCKRYGWSVIQINETTFKLIALKNYNSWTVKDFTRYCGATIDQDFSMYGRQMAFKTNFPESEEYNTKDSSNTTYVLEPSVISRSQLPTPSAVFDSSKIFCYNDNVYYKIGLDSSNNRVWEKAEDNIYNYEPKDFTESVESEVSTMAVNESQFMLREYYDGILESNYPDLPLTGYFPTCKIGKNKNWGIRNLLFVGLWNVTGGRLGPRSYPLLSCTRNLPDGTDVRTWSNVFSHVKNGIDYGIIPYWFKTWLNATSLQNVEEFKLDLPFHELKQLKWIDKISIQNIEFVIKSIIEPVPYKGFVKAKALRLLLDPSDATPLEKTTFYLTAEWQEPVNAPNEIEPPYSILLTNIVRANPVVKVFANAEKTKSAIVDNLLVTIRIRTLRDNNDGTFTIISMNDYQFLLTGSEKNLATSALDAVNSSVPSIAATSDGKYAQKWRRIGEDYTTYLILLPSTDYVVL